MTDTKNHVVAAGTMSGMAQPRVQVDDELVLRPWKLGDAPAVVKAFTTPDIMYFHSRRCDSIFDAERWIVESRGRWQAETSSVWAMCRADSDEVLGRMAMHTDLRAGRGEVTYWLLPEARGRGVATRSCIAATTWAHEFGLHRVQLHHSTLNAASHQVAIRSGFTSEGVLRGANLHSDGWHDMHLHSHLATD
jgi:ribosomal-protein-alanine N-acetyltransferase